ncbi:hypothetical protein [Paenibacillus sp. HJGM_3]|uniref:DUF7352 domain-containing protein n=1 Tax=Paenibacillus sp. HJGM_3 TaxID=3379816 RepID=UPI00385FB608
MSVIYKYPIDVVHSVHRVETPASSTVISAIEQNGLIVIYVHVPDPYAPALWDGTKSILVLGTGCEFDGPDFEEMRFINTVKVGVFVWHVFELMDSGGKRL